MPESRLHSDLMRYLSLLLIFNCTAALGDTTYLVAPGLIDVKQGVARTAQVIVIDDGIVEELGPAADVTIPDGADVQRLDAGNFVVPGLIDAHVHLLSDPKFHGYKALGVSVPQATLQGVVNARRTLQAGVTTVRMVGARGYGDIALRDAINAGDIPGPRILTAGIPVGITGGHCSDGNLLPFEAGKQGAGVADGPWAMRAKVRQNVKYGADLIKTCSTGGVLSKGTEVGAPQSTLEELTALVEEAHMHGRKVASHAHGATGIKNAIRAGVDSVDHASFIDDEGLRLAKRNGTSLVMDIYVTEYILGEGEAAGILPESLAKERRTGETQRENFRKAHERGVRIVFGTDAGVYPHGDNLKQLSRMVRFGMSPAEALRAATLHAAELLGLDGQVGELKAGAYADLVVVNGNPLDDISLLETPVAVMKGGKWVKR